MLQNTFNIISKLRNENLNSLENQNFISNLYMFEIENNPIKNVKWFNPENKNEINYDSEHIQELINDGYEVIKVTFLKIKDMECQAYVC